MSEHRLRALVLAVLMVTSVVAGSGVAVAGGSSGNSTLVVDAAGNTGDYDTVQGALADADSGDTIRVRAGDYDLGNGVAVPKDTTGVSIVGAGQGETTLDAADASCWGLKVSAGAHDTTLEGFTLVGASDAPDYCTGLKANFVENLRVSDVTVQHSSWGEIDLNNVRGATLTDVTTVGGEKGTYNAGVGVAVTASEDVTLRNVETRHNSWGGIGIYTAQPEQVPSDWNVINEPDDVTVTGHTSTGESVPIYAQNDTGAGLGYGDLTLDGYEYTAGNPNHKADSTAGEYTFFHKTRDAAVSYAASETYQHDTSTAYVNPLTTADDGTTVADGDTYVVGSADGSASTSMSLATALSRVDANDTISLGTGVYDPVVVRTPGLTLEAADGEEPTIRSADDGGIGVRANDVTISGLTVEGPAKGNYVGIRASGPGEGGPAKNVVIEDTHVSDFLTGIQIAPQAATPDAPATLRDNYVIDTAVGVSVSGNTTVSDNVLAVAKDGEGIGVGGSDAATDEIRNNRIVLNRSAGLGYSPDPARGIGLYSGAGDVIESNTVTGGDAGVYVSDGVGAINGETERAQQATALLTRNDVANVSLAGTTYDGSVFVGGTTYPSLAAAEDAAAPGETISLTSGTYDYLRVETDDVTITGPASARLDGLRLDATGVTVETVTVETREILGENVGVYVGDTDDHTIRNVTVVSDAEGDRGVLFSSTGSDTPESTTLEDVKIDGPTTGVYAGDATGLTVTGATITNTTAGVGGIQGEVTVADTEFTNTFEAVGVGPGSVDLSEQTGLAGAPVGGYTAYHTSIQQTVDRAEAGSTVEVLPGTYNESLDVRKDLTLAGSGEGETLIDATDADDYGLFTAANVTLQDFTLRGPTVDAKYAYGIKAQFTSLPDEEFARTDVTIEDVTVRNSDKTEIDLNGVGSAHLADVTADGNGTGGAGIALSDTRDVTIEDATTTGNDWGAVAVYTNGDAVPAGTDGVTFAGDNSFENSVYLQGDLSLITNVEVPADATHEVTSEQGGYVGYFDSQADAEAFVAAEASPDAFLIRSLEESDGEEGDTYTVAENQSVGDTVSQVPTGSTVVVNKSSVDSSISISKSVTLRAGEVSAGGGSVGTASISADATRTTSRPTITSTVSISNYADDVTVEGFAFDLDAGGGINANGAGDDLTIRNNVFESGRPESGAAVAHGGEARAQSDSGAQSGWVVADNEFGDIDGQALRLWNLQSVTVEDNEFSGLTGSAVSHIGVEETTVRNNSFETVDKAGVYVDSVESISPLGAQGVTVENNSFENVGAPDAEYDQGGVNVGANVADLSEITVRGNDFESGQFGIHVADDAQDATGSIRASFNYWNAPSGPSGVAGGEGVPVTAGVTVSPSLPDPTSEYEDVRDVTGGTYSVTVPADGEPRVVAFPADVEGTAGEVFGNFSGNVFAYDAESGSWDRVENTSREIDALDAFVVVPDENASDLTISYTLAPSTNDAPSVPPESDLDAGWNLVGAPQFGAADEAFGASTADPARVLKTDRGPTGEPFAPGFESETGVVGDTDAVSPFEGYWVYATEDGTLAGNAPPGTDASELEDLLKEA